MDDPKLKALERALNILSKHYATVLISVRNLNEEFETRASGDEVVINWLASETDDYLNGFPEEEDPDKWGMKED